MIRIPKHIAQLTPYKAGKPIDELAREKGITKIVKLASNENPLGPSPKAMDVISKNINQLHRYTNPAAFRLVNAIAKKINKLPSQIVTGSGSDSILQYIVTAFSDIDDEMLTSEGTFIGWYVNVNKYGRPLKKIQLNNYYFNLDAIADAVTEKTKIIYLANPNNPTGSYFTKQQFDEFVKKIPNNILIVLDEAYTVYAESLPDYPNGVNYDLGNLLVIRTLSKAYGLAGLRIGYAAGAQELIKELYKVKLPFEPNMLAQEAAIAALDDDEFLTKTVELNKVSLNIMKTKFDQIGIQYVPTAANFFMMIFHTAEFAFLFNEGCLNRGLILRYVDTFGIPEGVRINSGTLEETKFALDVIEDVYFQLKKKYEVSI
ncbi:MAG: histidinol-phosphate transaminase [Ignavibacteriaceae bacterium]|nr:histidinol-phosphate transaminase [Ignavibacteriaceae bacterium]